MIKHSTKSTVDARDQATYNRRMDRVYSAAKNSLSNKYRMFKSSGLTTPHSFSMIELTKLRVVPVPPMSGVLMDAGSLAMVSSTARSSL